MNDAQIGSLIPSPEQVYIIDVYSPYARNDNVLYKFHYHDLPWAIRHTALEWGKPSNETALDLDDNYSTFHYFNTYEEALDFVKRLKQNELP